MRNSGQKPFPVNAKNEARLNHLRSISSFLRQEMYTLLCTCVDYQMQSCFCIITIENICWRFNLNGTVNLGASCQVHVQGSRVKSMFSGHGSSSSSGVTGQIHVASFFAGGADEGAGVEAAIRRLFGASAEQTGECECWAAAARSWQQPWACQRPARTTPSTSLRKKFKTMFGFIILAVIFALIPVVVASWGGIACW